MLTDRRYAYDAHRKATDRERELLREFIVFVQTHSPDECLHYVALLLRERGIARGENSRLGVHQSSIGIQE